MLFKNLSFWIWLFCKYCW